MNDKEAWQSDNCPTWDAKLDNSIPSTASPCLKRLVTSGQGASWELCPVKESSGVVVVPALFVYPVTDMRMWPCRGPVTGLVWPANTRELISSSQTYERNIVKSYERNILVSYKFLVTLSSLRWGNTLPFITVQPSVVRPHIDNDNKIFTTCIIHWDWLSGRSSLHITYSNHLRILRLTFPSDHLESDPSNSTVFIAGDHYTLDCPLPP